MVSYLYISFTNSCKNKYILPNGKGNGKIICFASEGRMQKPNALVSANRVTISTNHVAISTNHVAISANHVAISANHVTISANHVAISFVC